MREKENKQTSRIGDKDVRWGRKLPMRRKVSKEMTFVEIWTTKHHLLVLQDKRKDDINSLLSIIA